MSTANSWEKIPYLQLVKDLSQAKSKHQQQVKALQQDLTKLSYIGDGHDSELDKALLELRKFLKQDTVMHSLIKSLILIHKKIKEIGQYSQSASQQMNAQQQSNFVAP